MVIEKMLGWKDLMEMSDEELLKGVKEVKELKVNNPVKALGRELFRKACIERDLYKEFVDVWQTR